MTTIDTYLLLRAFADELARCGVRHAVTSPGSRSTPLVLTLARERRLTAWSQIDERCAGFFALGLAKGLGLPAVLACTSGTAAANYLPAVIESREARVPLIVLTADRPPELRDVGAGQTIDQIDLYGSAVKWFVELGTHSATPDRVRWIRQLACRACATTLEGRPGAVHVNVPLREPLVLDAPLPPDPEPGRAGRAPWIRVSAPRPALSASAVDALAADLARRHRAVIVAGRDERGGSLGPAAAGFAQAAGIPLLADPLSGARRGPCAIAHYDALLRVEAFAGARAPQLVLRVGDLPTSKPLRAWLAGPAARARQVAIDPEGAWQDPAAVVSERIVADAPATLDALARRVEDDRADPAQAAADAAPDARWLDAWRAADARAAAAIERTLAPAGLSEPVVAQRLGALLPAEATLFTAASMPVRDLETFVAARPAPPRIVSNRGANGIDGTVSAAAGVAGAAAGPVVLLIGDVALAHDIGGLLAATRAGVALTIVVVDNGGGGIFDFLAVSSQRDAYEEHVATPPGYRPADAAGLARCEHEVVTDVDALTGAVGARLGASGVAMIEVRTDRAANVALHRACWDAVADALGPDGSG